MRPTIAVEKTDNSKALVANMQKAQNMSVYVGIPAESGRGVQRMLQGIGRPVKAGRGKKYKSGIRAAAEAINNAQLLWIQSKGSPVRGIPARPVLEPAIEANKEAISAELRLALAAEMKGDPQIAAAFLKRAGLTARNATRNWFFDPRNGWQKLASSTIRRKGSDQPLIDSGAMRAAITYVVDHPSIATRDSAEHDDELSATPDAGEGVAEL